MILSACVFGYGSIGKAVVDKFSKLTGYGKDIRIHVVYVKNMKDFPDAQLNNQNFWKIKNENFNDENLSITISDDQEWLESSGYLGHDVIFDCSEKDDNFLKEIENQMALNSNFVLYKCSKLEYVDTFIEMIVKKITELRELKYKNEIENQIKSLSEPNKKDQYKLTLYARKTFYSSLNWDPRKFIKLDPERLYESNSHGFRSNKETEKTSILFAGCSVTYGMGVSLENIWASHLGKLLNLNYTNLGKPGASVGETVTAILKYIETYGNPKFIFCLFPDYERLFVPIDNLFYSEKPNKNDKFPILGEKGTQGNNGKFFRTIHLHAENKDPSWLIRLPYDYKKVFSTDLAIYEAMKSIRYLEQYCKAAGINLMWSTWDHIFNDLLLDAQSDEETSFENFFNLYDYNFDYSRVKLSDSKNPVKEVFFRDSNSLAFCLSEHVDMNIKCSCEIICHTELKETFPDEFYAGTDSAEGHPHFGAHWHRHAAESFYNQLNKAKSI